ncbi:MAG: hypothetical protein M5R36_04925 [Deltaproteobacteria bacterium]|nr:hypothetical protein [Deltaproteobacteria bacterium]
MLEPQRVPELLRTDAAHVHENLALRPAGLFARRERRHDLIGHEDALRLKQAPEAFLRVEGHGENVDQFSPGKIQALVMILVEKEA